MRWPTISLVLFLAACVPAPEEVAPKLALRPGEQWHINEMNTGLLSVPDNGATQTFESREALGWLLTVDAGDVETGWDVTMKWESAERPSGLTWDEAVDIVLRGKEFQFHLSPQGAVSDVRGLEPLQEPVAAVLDAHEQLAESGGTAAVKDFYRQAVSTEGMRGHLERLFLFFPKDAVMTGDEFGLGTITLPHQDLAITRTGRAIKAGDKVIDIVFRGDVNDLMQNDGSRQQGMETGTARLNAETGQLEEVSREIELSTESSIGPSQYSESSNVVFSQR